ncbi:MAG: extracellular solute-binding protein [Ruminiclostridium sp.]|nr:extracellular solute-binding protein [Ruminiclostridium sp.]
MKTSRKALTAALTAVVIISAAGCGGGGSRGAAGTSAGEASETTSATAAPVTTTEDPNKEIDIQVDYDKMADIGKVDASYEQGAGKLYESGKTADTVHVLCWFDFHNVEPESKISKIFAERFGGTVETEIVSSLEITDRLGVLMAAGNSPDIMRYSDAFLPSYFINNRITPLDDWLDKDSPVWSDMSEIIDRFEYNGKHYFFPYALTATEYGVTYCTKEVEETGMTDPMDLYFAGEWDWNAFEEIMMRWKSFNPDKSPMSWPGTFGCQLAATTGTPVIELKGSEIVNNLKNANVVRAMEFIEKLYREDVFWEGWHGPDQLDSWSGTLFFVMPLDWALPCGQEMWFKNNYEGEIRTVPMPRDPESDKYYMTGAASGYCVPQGSNNVQGAASFILASRMYANDPEIVEANREQLLYNGGYYYIKCPDCKHKFDSERDVEGATCPECGAPRKAKWKLTYTPEQMQVYDDLVDPSKFSYIFSCHGGFGQDMIDTFDTIFNAPIVDGDTYNHALSENEYIVESILDEYRSKMTG